MDLSRFDDGLVMSETYILIKYSIVNIMTENISNVLRADLI